MLKSAKPAAPPKPAQQHNQVQQDKVRAIFSESVQLKQTVMADHLPELVEMANACAGLLARGGKLMLCGNGGSAADAQHLAAEMLVRLRPHVNRQPIAAISLAMDSSSLTACANDYDYHDYFARMAQAVGRPGDALIAITTSGKSPGIVKALETARAMGITTMGLLGSGGGPALALCDHAFVVPSGTTGRIQEVHITAGHALMELIEDALAP